MFSNYTPLMIACLVCAAIVVAFLLLRLQSIKAQIQKNQLKDPQTGLGNILFFKNHIENTVSDSDRTSYYVAYIVINSIFFKNYYGNYMFDNAIKYTSKVLNEKISADDACARITENGFAVCFKADSVPDAQTRIKNMVYALNKYCENECDTSSLMYHASFYNLSKSDKNCELLLFLLRKNCYRIINTDRSYIYCDASSMNNTTEQETVENIINALNNSEFKLYLQFIVENKTHNVVSAEALSRWESPEKGIIMPGKYIGVMENSGLIGKLDYYMFESVCKQLENWQGTEMSDVSVSCNFTRITLSEEHFIDKITAIAQKYNFDRSKLIIEITEDAMEENIELSSMNVAGCKEMGFRIALDDLGSGYTSLSNLCSYPIDIVKIDRDILLNTDNQKGKNLFSGIIALAHNLGLKVVCEGIETLDQNRFVESSECDYIQGWFYSKAFPAYKASQHHSELKNFVSKL